MRFAVLGSCIGGDVVNKAKEKGWVLCANYISFNPLSFIESQNNKIKISVNLLKDETNLEKQKFVDNFNNDVLENIRKLYPDFVLVDLGDLRINIEYLTFENGNQIAYTKKSLSENSYERIYKYLEENLQSKIINKTLKNVSNLTDEELKDYLINYKELLTSYFGEGKVIFFKPKLANQYIDSSQILYTPNFRIAGNTNVLMDRIYKVFSEISDFIDSPEKIIGDSSCLNAFEYHYCKPYYDYMINAISYFIGNSNNKIELVNKEKEKCELEIHRLYNKIFCNQILDKFKNRLDKDIVLVAKTRQFEEMLKERYQKDIYAYIEYNKDSNMDEIEEQIKQLQSENNNLIYAVPEVFNHYPSKGLYTCLYNNNLTLNSCVFPNFQRQIFDKFSGYYEDVHNNIIISKSVINAKTEGLGGILINGVARSSFNVIVYMGAYAEVRDGFKMSSGPIIVMQDAKMIIDNTVSIVGGEITLPATSCLKIGKDCMFSVGVIIYTGDGHPIFQLQEDGKYKQINPSTLDKITIGDHVWIGYGAKVLSGANIGDGSIVGAGSIVNKKFPNNVLIVGIPGKVIKKNVAWVKSNEITMLEQDKYVYENFANETQE